MLGLSNSLSRIPVPSAAAAANEAPVTDGLVGYFKASEASSIITDTSGGTTTVSQWNNVASESGGEDDQDWGLSQGTKANQPVYSSADGTISFDGTDILTGLSGKMAYNNDWTAIWIADAETRNFAVWAGGTSVSTYIRFHDVFSVVGPRINGNNNYWSPDDTGKSGTTTLYTGDYNVIGVSWDGSERASIDANGYIINQYLWTPSDNCDHSNCAGPSGYNNYSAPSAGNPFINLGAYNGQTNAAAYICKEFMVFNRKLTQSDVTAIYNYADDLVTLNEFTVS